MADQDRLAELRAELAALESEARKEATTLLSEKVSQVVALVKECEKIATENRLEFVLPFGGPYGEGCRFDGEAAATGRVFDGWDTSYC